MAKSKLNRTYLYSGGPRNDTKNEAPTQRNMFLVLRIDCTCIFPCSISTRLNPGALRENDLERLPHRFEQALLLRARADERQHLRRNKLSIELPIVVVLDFLLQ